MELTILGLATNLIKEWEGCELMAYPDVADVWTIGYGHIKGIKKGDTCTQAQADAWLEQDTRKFHDEVLRLTVGLPSTKRQHAAMICLCYNIGSRGFRNSSVLRLHSRSRYAEAADAFLMWNKITVNGKKVVSNGLKNRREAERRLYLT